MKRVDATTPDLTGPAGRGWEVRAGEPPTGIFGFVVEVPNAHPWWDKWFVAVIHLRDTPGMKPAHKVFPEATHEFLILSMDPGHPVDLEHPTAHFLTPADFVEQIGGCTDEQAVAIGRGAVAAILTGRMSPDSDYRAHWKILIKRTVEHMVLGGHAKEST